VTEWGNTANWPTHVPAALDDAEAVAAGGLHSLALRRNGTVVGWGDNSSGQVNIPFGLSNVAAIAGGGRHSLALKADGSVVAWGDNSARQLNVPADLANVVGIAAGSWHSVAVRADGSVTAWGGSAYQTNIPIGLTNAVAVAAGFYHSLALTADGRVYAWGQTGTLTNVPAGLSNVIAIAASADHSIALQTDGTVVVWGDDWALVNPPLGVSGLVAVAAGEYTSLALIGVGPPVLKPTATNLAGIQGRSVYLHAEATGALPLAYRWQFNGVNLPGATNATLSLNNLQPEQAGVYSVVVANTQGAATNASIHLTILPLAFTAQPQSQTVLPSATARFEVGVIGQPPFRYQWLFNGAGLTGATNSSLVITNVQLGDAGPYSVIVTNDFGWTRSADALLSVSSVVAWGTNNYGQLNVPGGLVDVVALAAGLNHSLALRSNGTVVAWGDNRYGQTNVPPGLSGVVAIAAGQGNHSLALKSDGTVVAWGSNSYQQTNVPPGVGDVVAIAAGGTHSLALKSDGTVLAWGSNLRGQTNVPTGLTGVVGLAALANASAALRADGTVIGWGTNGTSAAPASALSNVVSVAAGSSLMGLRPNGSAVVWSGGFRPFYFTPTGFTNVVAISASANQDLALKSDGMVLADSPFFPKVPAGLTNMGMIAAGSYHNVAAMAAGSPFIVSGLPDRSLLMGSTDYFWVSATGARPLSYQWQLNGTNIAGATGAVLTLSNVQSNRAGLYSVIVSNALGVASSRQFTMDLAPLWITNQPQNVLTFQGGSALFSVRAAGPAPFHYQWQFNGSDLAGATSSSLLLTKVQMSQAGAYAVRVSNAYGALVSGAATLSVNRVVAWGDSPYGMTNVPAGLSNAAAVSMGVFGCAALKEDGTVVAWGEGWGGLRITNVPSGLSNVVTVSCGSSHALALKSDRTVVGWGSTYSVPDGLTNVVAVTAGEAYFSAALLADGTVRAWGENNYGQTDVPPGLTNVVFVSSRRAEHALALIDDGTVVGWGNNDVGQTTVPDGLTNAAAVSAVYALSVALREDGTMTAWGDNSYGQTNVPAGLTNAVKVNSDGLTVLALKADGTVTAWGYNWSGQTNVPAGLSNVVDVVAGGSCVALKQDGTLVTWGAAVPGQAITSLLRNTVAVDAGGAYVALLGDGPPDISRKVANLFWRPMEFGFSFPTERGRVYLVEFKDALTDRTWSAFPLIRGNGKVHTWSDTSPLGRNRFYRVRVW
jgi:alpha-tubulin suppressor-like RCC1 family protein